MDKKLVSLASIFFLLFGTFITVLLFNNQLGSLGIITRASRNLVPASAKTVIFAIPLTVPANGTSSSEVTIISRNDAGLGVPNTKVEISSTVGQFDQNSVVTDTQGKAVFHLTSTSVGIAKISAVVASTVRPSNEVSVSFIQP